MHQSLTAGRLLLASMLLLAACAKSPLLPPETSRLPARVELSSVPFFPQRAYQCGPAALATVLRQRGVQTSPELLQNRVFIPGREGSLQVEMVATARSYDMLVYPLAPRLEAVLAEVAAGNPVLVLQNLAFGWYPIWHFAVVIGYDQPERTLILRSGTTRRWSTSFASFDKSWARGGRWAVLTLPADKLPARAALHPWLKAASDLEETGHRVAAQRAYRAAVKQWPEASLAWFALANSHYAGGDMQAAEDALRKSLARQADFAAGWFNLAQLLNERGCPLVAEQARVCAQRLATEDKRFVARLTPPGSSVRQCQAVPVCPRAN